MLYYDDFQTRTFIHLFDECNQNWFSVASIIEDALTTIKWQEPRLNEAFLRSDNTSCYHCAILLLSLPSLGQRVGVCIVRYDFTEAQAGKDLCDRPDASDTWRAMTKRQPIIWKLLSTRMGASKAATQRCVRLTKSPKTWPSTRWVAYSLWTTSCTLNPERSSLGGPTMLDLERSFQQHYWRPSLPDELTTSSGVQQSWHADWCLPCPFHRNL